MKTRKNLLAVAVSTFAGVLVGGFLAHYFPPQKPVAAVGLVVCGKVQAVTIIMSDGKMKRFEGPSEEGAALIRKVPVENFSSYGINTALCSPPKVY